MTVTTSRLDDAARAGWLYYVAGNTQDEIAAKLGVSRQSAQRLVSLAISEGLVKVRIDHPIARCLELGAALRARFGLDLAEVVPTDPDAPSSNLGLAQAVAAEIERWLMRPDPVVMGIGTGRTLRAGVEQLPRLDCPRHRIVSLAGNITPEGAASMFNVVFTMADLVNARFFPMPLPVIASSAEERALLHAQPIIRRTLELAARADVAIVGIGDLGPEAPLLLDGFITQGELDALQVAGGVMEILGLAHDAAGRALPGLTNARVANAALPATPGCAVIAAAKGGRKLPGIRAAIAGRLISGLLTDEATAEALLS